MSFSIVIPSKTASSLVACIRAIREAGETCRIIVVDDGVVPPGSGGPEDGVAFDRWAKANNVGFVPGIKPFVFARNINIGIQAAGGDDVILLNDDALLKTPNGFRWLTRPSRPCFGLIAASCDTVGNPNQFRHQGDILRPEPRMVCFVCVYIPRSTINTVGLLDERFVGYGMDDDDYSLRVRNAGLKLGIFDGCFVDHGSLTSTFRGGPQTGGDFRPNMKLFIEKWGVDNWGRDRAHSEFADLFPKAAR